MTVLHKVAFFKQCRTNNTHSEEKWGLKRLDELIRMIMLIAIRCCHYILTVWWSHQSCLYIPSVRGIYVEPDMFVEELVLQKQWGTQYFSQCWKLNKLGIGPGPTTNRCQASSEPFAVELAPIHHQQADRGDMGAAEQSFTQWLWATSTSTVYGNVFLQLWTLNFHPE